MTSVELKNLLQDLAASGDGRVDVDEQQLIARIRARRRRRGALTAAVAASTVVVVAAGAYAVRPNDGIDRPPVAVTPTAKAAPAPRFGELCGKPFTAKLPAQSPLQLTVPSKVLARQLHQPFGSASTLLTNTSDSQIDLTSATAVWGILVKDDVVVAVTPGMNQAARGMRLAAGKSEGYTADIALVDCRTIKAGGDLSTGRSIGPGTYQLYVQLDLIVHAPSDPAPATTRQWTTVESGPWSVELE